MSLFTKKETPVSSLAAAYAALMQRFERAGRKGSLDVPTHEVWDRVADLGGLEVLEVGELGTWPRTNDAIIRFQFRSLEEPTTPEGMANIIDHYCLVANWVDKEILDSADGVIKQPGYYGEPMGWASYKLSDKPAAKPVTKKNKVPDDFRTIKVLDNTDAWKLATQLKQPAEAIIEHNELEDPHFIPAGTILHLPYPQEKKEQKLIRFELLDKPRKMHVVKPGGTRKWAFGNAKEWGDIKPTGPLYAEGANVEIHMIAHVPLEENGEEITAAYMMDSIATGDYRNTGKIQFSIGFSHKHLADGHVEAKPKEPAPVAEPKINTATPEDIELALAPPKAATPWKDTFKPLNEQRLSKIFLANEDLTVPELDNRRKPVFVPKHRGIKVFGTFEKDGVTYARPTDAVDAGLWFGIPFDKLIDEDELYNTHVDLPTRVAINGSLSIQERGVVVLAKVLSVGTRIATLIKNKNKGEKNASSR